MKRLCVTLALIAVWCVPGEALPAAPADTSLAVSWSGGYGQVEVGGPYAGAEFHGSRPLPSRISFYYPVANSIDLSTDYWKRGDSRPIVAGIQIDNGMRHWIGKEPWSYTLSPHKVTFRKSADGVDMRMEYEFCINEPAMVYTLTVKNTSQRKIHVQLYTHLKTTLRTCQTYARFDSASTVFRAKESAIIAAFVQPQAGRASVIVGNGAAEPSGWTSDAAELNVADSGWSRWTGMSGPLGRRLMQPGTPGNAVSAFVYERDLAPGDSLPVVQFIASCRGSETDKVAAQLASSWRADVRAYDAFVRRKALRESSITTGDPWIDASGPWARAILATNAHYIDGVIMPMPCPAEYNFFFTHDVLLTNLAAVHFDPARVKENLLYIMSLSQDDIIPHAYYWRDDGFKTELCTPDNWNHLWFILLNGTYLRHTGDTATVARLYPLVSRSLGEILRQHRPDGLMYAFRPDWWDIGRNEGPRAFITILTIRALREYLYLSVMMRRNLEKLQGYEQMADEMERSLTDRLWDDRQAYLINYNGAAEDRHYYMGSLLAPAFHLLDIDKGRRMMESATRELVAPKIGVRTVFPVDFNTDSVRKFFRFVGNEAGDPYVYANGGVWPHCNAWYALGLQSTGSADDALRFFREIMTLQGVIQSPMGQPAMYEYRFSDPSSPEYGKVDKPSFLWAGGFYLYTLYHLLGVSENAWNVSLGVHVPRAFTSLEFDEWFSGEKHVVQKGTGGSISVFQADGADVHSRVLPLDRRNTRQWSVELGDARSPYLDAANAIVRSVRWDNAKGMLAVVIQSFQGHRTDVRIVSPKPVTRALVGGKEAQVTQAAPAEGTRAYDIVFPGSSAVQQLQIAF